MSGRVLHLGLGAFARAHSVYYTHLANQRGLDRWSVSGFTGTKRLVADQLNAQRNRYHLVIRHPDRDEIALIDELTEVRPGTDTAAWAAAAADPVTSVLTVTVTEKGYRTNASGALDFTDALVAADIERLRSDRFRADLVTAPGRLAQAALVRVQTGSPLTIVSCDNLPANGEVVRRVILDAVDAVDPAAIEDLNRLIGFSSSMVDRITPATTAADLEMVQTRTGVLDQAAVTTEPFSEWVLTDSFTGPKPDWHAVGATIVTDVEPHERRKLLLLNGAHSLLAYTGLRRGIPTIANAMTDPDLERLVEAWWQEAAALLPNEMSDVTAYTRALRSRFRNPRIEHRLAQIANDGSAKLRIRTLPVIVAARDNGKPPPPAATAVLSSWIGCWLNRDLILDDPAGEALRTAAAGPDAPRRLLEVLDPALAADQDVVQAVLAAL